METWIVEISVAVGLFLVAGGGLALLKRKKSAPQIHPKAPVFEALKETEEGEPKQEGEPALSPPPPPSSQELMVEGLKKTRGAFSQGLFSFFQKKSALASPQEWDALEETLLAADVGMPTTTYLLSQVKEKMKEQEELEFKQALMQACREVFESPQGGDPFDLPSKPYVISIVGINGVGKTTTVGKLAHHFSNQGKKVLMGATDTFRAAAMDQLRVWADRTKSQIVVGREGADPGAVAFDAVTAGKARDQDVVLIDTAGRLHTKTNLMDELKKIHRVCSKVIAEAPHQTWLVLDGTAGQNSIEQARQFHSALGLTGLIITKLDGTAKGGALFAVAREFNLPIHFIGLGEQASELIAFDAPQFVETIFS